MRPFLLRHATIAAKGGKGVDNSGGGVVAIAHAIVQDCNGGDLVSVSCANVTWSNVKSQDCTGTGNDLHTTCALGSDYRRTASSACLDFGPSPAAYTGSPCFDLDGDVRLRDHDGNGIATIDPGAFERANGTLTPGDIANLRFTSKTTLTWNADPSGLATEYHVYRGLRTDLSYGNFGACRDDLDANRTDLSLTDASTPTPGQCFAYAITAARPGAATQPEREGTMGLTRCMERSNVSPCPQLFFAVFSPIGKGGNPGRSRVRVSWAILRGHLRRKTLFLGAAAAALRKKAGFLMFCLRPCLARGLSGIFGSGSRDSDPAGGCSVWRTRPSSQER